MLCKENKKQNVAIEEIIKNMVLLGVCIASLFFLGYAWFNYAKEARYDDFELASVGAVGFQVSTDGETYTEQLSIPFPQNLSFEPVSGDGTEGSMYYPILPAGSNDPSEAVEWVQTEYDDDAEQNKFYRFHVYFRALVAGYVQLTSASINPLASPEERQNANYLDAFGKEVAVSGVVHNPVSDSILGKLDKSSSIITKDYIAAAARISITNSGEVEEGIAKHIVVIPNSTYLMTSQKIVNSTTNEVRFYYAMNECALPNKTKALYHYLASSGDKVEYGERNFIYFFSDEINEESSGHESRLIEDQTGDYYVGEADVCIWIEGFDDEAVEALSGGQCGISLQFEYNEDYLKNQ